MQPDVTQASFDEASYLEANSDVATAVELGHHLSGLSHYLNFGKAEGRPLALRQKATDIIRFDEAWYVSQNPDVAAGIKAGVLGSGYDHWVSSGRLEGRIASPGNDEGDAFDETFYLRSYPMVGQDIARGRAVSARDHYKSIGRFRGYLPNGFAARPENAAGIASQFGGFWLDQANALDLIEGRLEIGTLTPHQAELLRHWVRYGYVVLPQIVSAAVVDQAIEEATRAYEGQVHGLKFECPQVGGYLPADWDPAIKTSQAKALDLHWLSRPICDLIFASPVREFLELVFQRRALASQSLTFLRGSYQAYHQDSVYVPYSLSTQFATSWIALEDVAAGGGELTFYPGSHKLPEYFCGGKFKTLWDAQRMLRSNSLREAMQTYSDDLEDKSRSAGLKPESFMAKKGDALIWHADLAHGALPVSKEQTRLSVVTHYCPSEVAPLTFERGNTAVRSYNNVAWYATSFYAD